MRRSFGLTILQLALAFFLIVAGVVGLMNSSAGELGQVVALLNNLFHSSTIATIMVITIAVMEILAGVFLIVEFFSAGIRLTAIILIIFIVLWVVNIILIDVIGAINGGYFGSVKAILNYLAQLSRHLMILGALIAVNNRSRL